MKILKSKRMRSILSLMLAVVMVVTLITVNNNMVNAGYDDTTTLNGIVSNIFTELEAIEGISTDYSENKITFEDSYKLKPECTESMLEIMLSEETGSKNMIKNIMTSSDEGSISINGVELDFSLLKDADAALAAISYVMGNMSAEDFFALITAGDTGIIATLNSNVKALDELFAINTSNGTTTVSATWSELLDGSYMEASHTKREGAAEELCEKIINSGCLKDTFEIEIKYDEETVKITTETTCNITVDKANDEEEKVYTVPVKKGSTLQDAQIAEPSYEGYRFICWNVDESSINSNYVFNSDTTIVASWEANNTKYVINLYKMNTEGTYVDVEAEILEKEGKTDTKLDAEYIDSVVSIGEGFTLDEVNSELDKKISGSGTTKVDIYYERNRYVLTYMDGTVNVKDDELYYDASYESDEDKNYVLPDEDEKVFYDWVNSTGESVSLNEFKMPARNEMISALWQTVTSLYTESPYHLIEDEKIYQGEYKLSPNGKSKSILDKEGKTLVNENNEEINYYINTTTGKYTESFVFELDNGRKTKPYEFSFIIDNTNPTFEVSYPEGWINATEGENIVIANIEDPVENDVSTGVSKVDVVIAGDIFTSFEDNLDADCIIEWETLPEGQYNVTINVYDKVGNVGAQTIEIKKDITAPEFSVSYPEGWINADAGEDIVVSGIIDPESEGISTGVSKVDIFIDGDVFASFEEDLDKDCIVEWETLPEGQYDVTINVYDVVGNIGTQKIEIKKDITDPDFTVSYPEEWLNEENKADINVTEIIDPEGNGVSTGVSKVIIKYGEDISKTFEDNFEDGCVFPWEELPEGEYYVEIWAYDEAGNVIIKSVKVKKDITAPELMVEASGNIAENAWNDSWNSLVNEDFTFMKFSNSEVNIGLGYSDPEPAGNYYTTKRSLISFVGYIILDKSIVKEEELINCETWTVVDLDNYDSTYKFIIDTEADTSRNAVVYVKVMDNAGNVTYGSSNGIIVDKRDPKPEISIDIPESQVGYYNSTVPVTYKVTDPATGEAYSGLKSVTYEMINEDNTDNNITNTTEYNAEDHVQTTNDQKVNIDGTKFNSNKVTFRVSAVDNAGNTVSKEIKLKIDTTAPAISVSYAAAKHQGRYYREDRVATITVTERNFDASNVEISITKNGVANTNLSNVTWTKVEGTGNGDDTKHVATITYSADADYTFNIKCTDLAGNKNSDISYSGGNEKKFTVDKTLPVVKVSYDETPSNNKYYDTGVNVTIVIKEHNFDAKAAVITSTGASTVGQFKRTDTDEYTAIISYLEENECEFDVVFIDKAGNAAKYNNGSLKNKDDYPLDEFVIDMTAPKNIVFATASNSANNGTVTATFNFEEEYFYDNVYQIGDRKSAVDVSIVGYKNGNVTSSFPFTLSANKGTINVKFEDFPRDIQWDDVYTVTTKVTDLAGNETSGNVVFSVNRHGSNYVFGTSTEKLVENYYTNTPQDIDVYEISASTKYVEDYTISLIVNGERKDLVEGTDFTVDHNWKVEYPEDYSVYSENNNEPITGSMIKEVGTSANNGWMINHYTINASIFDKEGEYIIVVSSTDTAGNSMASNTSKYESSQNVNFVYDKSLPSWRVSNSNENKLYKGETYDFKIEVSDDVSNVSKVVVIYNGETTEIYPEAFVDGCAVFTATQSYGWQELQIYVYDQAGNVTEEGSQSFKFSLTSNQFIQFFVLNWMYILIGLLVIAAGVIILLLIKKRKKTEK